MADDSEDIRIQLYNHLHVIDSGNFATSGPLANASNPGLFVHGVGIVGLPLSDRDAADLSRVSHEAPFGKGSETFVDPTVRKTWELNPNQFELRNPAWQSILNGAVEKVAQELGVVHGAFGVRVELHKLLLYDPGAFFDKHRDTEKAPGMFATLVIALPSEHTGGDVLVQHRDQERTLKTQGVCDFDYAYLAWYADVNHSVSKVKSGHRLVLTYNLIRLESDSSGMPSVLDDHKQKLTSVLSRWNQHYRGMEGHSEYVHRKMAYILDHQYSEANISLNNLKGKDQLRARYLLEACRDQDFCLFFAQFQYSQTGNIDEYQDDEDWYDEGNPRDIESYHPFINGTDDLESEWKVESIFQYNGRYIASGIILEDEDFIEDMDFTGIEPDDEECDGWTGNEGCTATHFYHRTCAIIVPRSERFDFFLIAEDFNVKEYVDTLLSEIQDARLSVTAREELEKFCGWTINLKWWKSDLATIARATLTLDRPDLLEKVVRTMPEITQADMFQELGKGLASREISAWQKGIKMAVSAISNVPERVKALDQFIQSYREATANTVGTIQDLSDFELEIFTSLAENNREVVMDVADAKALVQLSKYGRNSFLQVILPLIQKHNSNLDFIVACLAELVRAGEKSMLTIKVVQSLSRKIFNDMIPKLCIQDLKLADDRAQYRNAKRRRIYYEKPTSQALGDPAGNLGMLFQHCEKLSLSHEIEALAETIIFQSRRADIETVQRILLPLLKRLPPPVKHGSEIIGSPSYCKMFRTIFSVYINTHVGNLPPKPTTWERQPRGCGISCSDCVRLDKFLRMKDLKRYVFTVNGKRRDHIEERVRRVCKTETVREGTPYTLVVYKTDLEWEAAVAEWKKRGLVALKTAAETGNDKLEGLLGEGWEKDLGLSDIRAVFRTGTGERRPLDDATQGNGTIGGAGTKRKASERGGVEIIDLSEE